MTIKIYKFSERWRHYTTLHQWLLRYKYTKLHSTVCGFRLPSNHVQVHITLLWFMWSDFILKWSEVKWVKWVKWLKWSEVSDGKVFVDKGAMYFRASLYCGHLIILWLFRLGIRILHCVCFNLYCVVYIVL
jgi:hypothetical protein